MEPEICSKHHMREGRTALLAINSYVCMSQTCPHSYQVLCEKCLGMHKEHASKILSLEDLAFLAKNLCKNTEKSYESTYNEVLQLLGKVKYIREFKKNMDSLEMSINEQITALLEQTEDIMEEYASCEENLAAAVSLLDQLSNKDSFREFKTRSKELVNFLMFNTKKDRLEIEGKSIREGLEQRQNCIGSINREMEQLRDYSMKIVEVVLDNEESEEEHLNVKQKLYEQLKEQFLHGRGCEEQTPKSRHRGSLQKHPLSKPTNISNSTEGSIINRKLEDKITQTNGDWIRNMDRKEKDWEEKLEKARNTHLKAENNLQNQITVINKEKEFLNKEISRLKQSLQAKNGRVADMAEKLQRNKREREAKWEEHKQAFEKLVALTGWKDGAGSPL